MKKLLFYLLTVFAIFAFCIALSGTPIQENATTEETDDSLLGIGINGKIGIDAGGIVIPFDGSGPTPGFGF